MSTIPVRPRGRPRTTDDPSTVVAVERAIRLLRLLAAHDGLTVSEAAELGGQPLASTFRALTTLEAEGMVESEDMRFRIGAGAFRLGNAFLRRDSLVARAAAPMARLRDELSETVSLAIASGGEVLHLAEAEGPRQLRANFPPGSRAPLHASASGKALLAWGAVEAGALVRHTSLTITAAAALDRELSRIRDRGHALDDQESLEGMRGVAAPIFGRGGRAIAALSLSAPAFRLSLSDAQRAGTALRAAADLLTAATAGSGP
ncbi:IclR family transcriptional regulator [Cereibacter sp. SYSU M97828]|nr:IclR family transcriptional regulator [Cereibacter flavus]